MSQQLKGLHQAVHIVSDYSNRSQNAYVTKKYTEPIFKKTHDLTMSIDKGHVDLKSLPIFKFDATTNAYVVEIEYNGTFSDPSPVVFIPTSSLPTTDPRYYYIWSIQDFLFMVNTALETAFTNLSGKLTLPTGSKKPFFTFEPSTSVISLCAQQTFYDTYNTVQPINIYINSKLYSFFGGIPILNVGDLSAFSATLRDGRFKIYNLFTNIFSYGSENYLRMSTESGKELLSTWFQARGIYIVSSSLRTRNELMPNVNGQNINQNLELPVIYHYNFQYEGVKPLYVDFKTDGPYKILDMDRVDNLKTIDIGIYWFDKFGVAYPLYLNAGDSFNITLIFQEKI